MRVICIQKDWEVELLAQTSHQSSKLIDPDELPLSFRRTNQYRNLEFAAASETAFSRTKSETLKWPRATPRSCVCASTSRRPSIIVFYLIKCRQSRAPVKFYPLANFYRYSAPQAILTRCPDSQTSQAR